MALDEDARKRLSKLVHKERIAHLGTLRNGAPMVSMTLFVPESDFSAFYIHVSRLAWHTQDMLQDPRVALSIGFAGARLSLQAYFAITSNTLQLGARAELQSGENLYHDPLLFQSHLITDGTVPRARGGFSIVAPVENDPSGRMVPPPASSP